MLQCVDQLAPDVVEGVVVEPEAALDPAIRDAALGDEAPEDLFQDLLKVHASAPFAIIFAGRQPDPLLPRDSCIDAISTGQTGEPATLPSGDHRHDPIGGVESQKIASADREAGLAYLLCRRPQAIKPSFLRPGLP